MSDWQCESDKLRLTRKKKWILFKITDFLSLFEECNEEFVLTQLAEDKKHLVNDVKSSLSNLLEAMREK